MYAAPLYVASHSVMLKAPFRRVSAPAVCSDTRAPALDGPSKALPGPCHFLHIRATASLAGHPPRSRLCNLQPRISLSTYPTALRASECSRALRCQPQQPATFRTFRFLSLFGFTLFIHGHIPKTQLLQHRRASATYACMRHIHVHVPQLA